jgi:hypothetical protein
MAIDMLREQSFERGAQPKPRSVKFDCGCIESFVGLLVGLAIFARHFIILHADLYSPAEQILAAFAIGLAGAVIGKFLGLGRVRYSHRASRSRQRIATRK